MSDGVSELIRKVEEGHETVFDLVKNVEGDEPTLRMEIARRQLLPEAQPPLKPTRAESPPRQHVFHSADALLAYLEAYKTDDTVILADVDRNTITAIIDEESDEGREMVTLEPQVHPRAKPWIAMFGAPTPVTVFAQFVMEHRRDVTAALDNADVPDSYNDGRQLAMTLSQVTASKDVTINRGRGNNSINGVMVAVTIQGERQDKPVQLPEEITLDIPLYVGEPTQRIKVDLLITEHREEIVVIATCADLIEQQVQAFLAMIEKLESLDVVCGLGMARYSDWKYLAARELR